MKKNILKTLFKIMITLTIMTFLLAGTIFAYNYITAININKNTITSGCVSLQIENSKNISIKDVYPISDKDGLKTKPYTYVIKNNCSYTSYYEITLNETLSNDGKVKVSLDNDSYLKPTLVNNLKQTNNLNDDNYISTYLLDTGYIKGKSVKNFDFRMWIDEDTTSFKGTYKIDLLINVIKKEGPDIKSGTVGYKIYQDNIDKNNIIKENNNYIVNNNYILLNETIFTISSINSDGSITITKEDIDLKNYKDKYFKYKEGKLISNIYLDLSLYENNTYKITEEIKKISLPEIVDAYLTNDKKLAIISSSNKTIAGYYISTSSNKENVLDNEFIKSNSNRIIVDNTHNKGSYYIYVKDIEGIISNYKKITIK